MAKIQNETAKWVTGRINNTLNGRHTCRMCASEAQTIMQPRDVGDLGSMDRQVRSVDCVTSQHGHVVRSQPHQGGNSERDCKMGYWEDKQHVEQATYIQDVCKRSTNNNATEGCGGSWIDKSDPWTARQVSAVVWRGISHRAMDESKMLF